MGVKINKKTIEDSIHKPNNEEWQGDRKDQPKETLGIVKTD